MPTHLLTSTSPFPYPPVNNHFLTNVKPQEIFVFKIPLNLK